MSAKADQRKGLRQKLTYKLQNGNASEKAITEGALAQFDTLRSLVDMKEAIQLWQLNLKNAALQAENKLTVGEHIKLQPGLYTKYKIAEMMGFHPNHPDFESIATTCVHGLEEVENPNPGLEKKGHQLYLYTHKETSIQGTNQLAVAATAEAKVTARVYNSFQGSLRDATVTDALHFDYAKGDSI